MSTNHTQTVLAVCKSFEFFTSDIGEVLSKPWLKVAIKSHIQKDTGLPRAFVSAAVNLIWASNEV